MVKSLPSSGRYTGSIPGWGTRIPHAAGQLSLCVAAIESVCTTTREKPTCYKKDLMMQPINK